MSSSFGSVPGIRIQMLVSKERTRISHFMYRKINYNVIVYYLFNM